MNHSRAIFQIAWLCTLVVCVAYGATIPQIIHLHSHHLPHCQDDHYDQCNQHNRYNQYNRQDTCDQYDQNDQHSQHNAPCSSKSPKCRHSCLTCEILAAATGFSQSPQAILASIEPPNELACYFNFVRPLFPVLYIAQPRAPPAIPA